MLKKKIRNNQESFSIEINKNIADLMDIDETTKLIATIVDGELRISPVNRDPDAYKNRLKIINDKLMKEYEPILKKLSET